MTGVESSKLEFRYEEIVDETTSHSIPVIEDFDYNVDFQNCGGAAVSEAEAG